MAFFLRYTDKLEIDLERKTSVHLCDGPDDADEFVDGLGHVQILNGLCGWEISAENEEDAIIEAEEVLEYLLTSQNPNAGGEDNGRYAYLFSGTYVDSCEDGALFSPEKIIKKMS